MVASTLSFLSRNFRPYQVFGANTDVGKTILSCLVSRAVQRKSNGRTKLWYLKPVSTGAADDADVKHLTRYSPGITTHNLYQFDDAVSPHVAAARKNTHVADAVLGHEVHSEILTNAGKSSSGFMLIETAGGPHSPGPSGSSQADIYRPLRLPTLFVADYRLGGISTSVSSYESLKIRGYDVDGVAVFQEDFYRNFEYFQDFFGARGIPLLVVPPPPERSASSRDDENAMSRYYDQNDQPPQDFVRALEQKHDERIDRIQSLASTAEKHIWYPFTQHNFITSKSLTVIDSAHGDYFQTLDTNSTSNMLRSTVDASASWWTQGLGHSNHSLTMAAANAAGRYGHVMFASAIHEPAMSLATKLLSLLGNPRLNRVFYSDNGSTGMEVAIKMALAACGRRQGWSVEESQTSEVLGFKNSYHGDTLGTVDMSEPSLYNENIPWYRGRGYWFDAPSVKMVNGQWIIEDILDYELYRSSYPSLGAIFDQSRDENDDLAARYKDIITRTLDRLVRCEKRRFGALVMESVILGAGGMILVDPLFQRTLVNVVRSSPIFSSSFSPNTEPSFSSDGKDWTGLPYVADEVFTGLYRVGEPSSACHLLGVDPDIAVYAKLLTGGLVPLATTLASESVFDAFLSDSKADALLHGHSYTAHPIGCAVAVESLKMLEQASKSGTWDAFRSSWAAQDSQSNATSAAAPPGNRCSLPPKYENTTQVWSVWHPSFLSRLSSQQNIESIWALGSVLAITLKDESGAKGYASNAAVSLQQHLLRGAAAQDQDTWNIHSRVLGNVLYFMTSQVCAEADVRSWEQRVVESLGRLSQKQPQSF